MARTRQSGRLTANGAMHATRVNVRPSNKPTDAYQDMLFEAVRSGDVPRKDDGPMRKRRRIGDRSSVSPAEGSLTSNSVAHGVEEQEGPLQTVYKDFGDSEDSEDSDIFEEVDLGGGISSSDEELQPQPKDEQTLEISLKRLEDSQRAPKVNRRKPVNRAEKARRLDVHKCHVLCLLGHLQSRSHWCNNERLQAILKRLVPRKTIDLFHLAESKAQSQRNHAFQAGLKEVSEIWKDGYKVNVQGLRRAFWADDAVTSTDKFSALDSADDFIDQDDFMQAAIKREGSRDIGAQLFCALLRALGVETRLVCSLQPLPFSTVAKGVLPEKPKPDYARFIPRARSPISSVHIASAETPANSWDNPRRRLGQPSFNATDTRHNPPPRSRTPEFHDSPYPIFWVETFNEPLQKWIPVDPLVRNTIDKPRTGFEPPANDRLNNMSYVVAFEEDGSAHDVTRRYAHHYNAKTRKLRVEPTKDGELWWKRAIGFFQRPVKLDRDVLDEVVLAKREAEESMPDNVQDFKDHPHYALERHLKRNEAIHPKKVVGKVGSSKHTTNKPANTKLESIYRRRDIHTVRGSNQWYRLGREVKVGEQPLKRAVPRKKRADSPHFSADEDEEEDEAGTGLYAEFQTDIFVPPSVVNGRIPRNAFGNLDVYVPTMLPAGSLHLKHPYAAHAAKVLGIDYADAVVGFEFRGRRGTAVMKGVVAADEYEDALVAVVKGLVDASVEAEEQQRTLQVLALWKKLMQGLRVKERIKEYEDADNGEDASYHDENEEDDPLDTAGGFFMEGNDGNIAQPTLDKASKTNPSKSASKIHFLPRDQSILNLPIEIVHSPHTITKLQERTSKDADTDLFGQEDITGSLLVEGVGAGGFVSEHYEATDSSMPAGAGGFLIEEDDDEREISAAASVGGGGFLEENELMDANPSVKQAKIPISMAGDAVTGADQVQQDDSSASMKKILNDTLANNISMDETSTVTETNREKGDNKAVEPETPALTEDPDTDIQSMLSHDPEDEDADPEWLV